MTQLAPLPLVHPGASRAPAGAFGGAPYAARRGVRRPATMDGGNGRQRFTPDGQPVDAEYVLYRLEEAGATLLSLPNSGPSTRLRQSTLAPLQDAVEAYGRGPSTLRPPVPSGARIDRMDQALAWIALIPSDRVVLRRLVGARSLVSPVTGRHLFSWRRLGELVGADHKAVQRWHAQGVDAMVAALNTPTG